MPETTKVRTVCDPNCHANPRCGILAHVRDNRIVAIEPGSFPHSDYDRRICLMGRSRLEYQYHRDRLLHPVRRVGARGENRWERISWGEAYEMIAARLSDITERYGKRSLAVIAGSGTSGVLTRGSSYRFAAAVGATAARAGAVDYGVPKGLEFTFGVRASTYFGPGGHEFADAVNSRTIVFWGGNDAETRFVDFPFVRSAQRRGARIVCVDPNRSATAAQSDTWISLRPGTDGALALGILHQIFSRGLHDEAFIRARTNGPFLVRDDNGRFLRGADIGSDQPQAYVVWDGSAKILTGEDVGRPALEGHYRVALADGSNVRCRPSLELLRELASRYPPDTVAAVTTVSPRVVETLAFDLATQKPAAIRIGYGVDRWYWSDHTARAVAAIAIVTGGIGIVGGGVSVHSGTYALPPGLMSFRKPTEKPPTLLDPIGLMNAIETGNPYPIRALWLTSSNLFNQTVPNRKRAMEEIIPKLEFIVVNEHFMTASAELADIVLPAATIFERLDLIPGMFLQLQQPAVPPEGESRTEFDIFKGIAERMGHPDLFGEPPERHLEKALATKDPLFRGVTLDRLRRDGVAPLNRPPEPYVAFQDHIYKTPSGRIEIYKEELVAVGAALPTYHEPVEASPFNALFKRFPLVLIFSHSPYRIHSTFANLEMLKQFEPEPTLQMHPDDAASRSIADGGKVRAYNDRGSVTLRCRFNSDLRRGIVVLPEGSWVRDFIDGDPYTLTHEQVNATSENYAFYDTLVEVVCD